MASIPKLPNPAQTPAARPARVASCANCTRPIVRQLAGPRAGKWLHTDGEEGCRDVWGHPQPGATATPPAAAKQSQVRAA
jgi:hypothetical protein